MNPSPNIQRFVVIGNPIAHSKSPMIHQDFARQTNMALQYQRLLAPLDGFQNTVAALKAAGVAGANVTVPFKLQALELAEHASPAAQFAQAANTLIFTPQGVRADNTDGGGLCRDLNRLLQAQGLSLADCDLLMLGSGGAASGCVSALHAAGLGQLTILNRTPAKAVELAARAEALGLPCQGGGFDMKPLTTHRPRVVVNATSASLQGGVPAIHPAWYQGAVLAYDMMYGQELTAFLADVHTRWPQLAISDGLGMLVFQAELAFEIWTGVRPDGAATLSRLRAALNKPR